MKALGLLVAPGHRHPRSRAGLQGRHHPLARTWRGGAIDLRMVALEGSHGRLNLDSVAVPCSLEGSAAPG